MGRVVVENNQITFRRNVVGERAFNATNEKLFATPENWTCEIPVAQDGGRQHMGIFENYANALMHGTPMLAPGKEGVNGLTISNAIHYSAWTGGWADIKNFPHEEYYQLLKERADNSKVVKAEVHIVADTESTYNR